MPRFHEEKIYIPCTKTKFTFYFFTSRQPGNVVQGGRSGKEGGLSDRSDKNLSEDE